jgi:hypothetical protein
MTKSRIALSLLALCALLSLSAATLAASPVAVADATPAAGDGAAAVGQLPLFAPEAEAVAGGPQCKGQSEELFNYYLPVYTQQECTDLCTGWCDGLGGRVTLDSWTLRGLDCFCRCCV